MRFGLASVALLGCGPVLLGDEVAESSSDSVKQPDAGAADRGSMTSAGRDAGAIATPMEAPRQDAEAAIEPAEKIPQVFISVSPPDCDNCYRLEAGAFDGEEPFKFLWNDGSFEQTHIVCADEPTAVGVIAIDGRGVSSDPSAMRLLPRDAPCEAPPPLLCIENGGFEGRAGPNLGLSSSGFDAPPWRTCTNPSETNLPDIANDQIPQIITTPVTPTEGATFVAMTHGEQVSQVLCEPVTAGSAFSLALDLTRVNLNSTSAPTGTIGLELWGGTATDCMRRELLWQSPAIDVGWHRLCVTLEPQHYMNALYLRTFVNRAQENTTYLLVDNLVPVESCM